MNSPQPAASPFGAPGPSLQAVFVLWLVTIVIDAATAAILLWEPFGEEQAFGTAMLGGAFVIFSPPVLAAAAFFSKPSFATGTIFAVAVVGVPGTLALVMLNPDGVAFDVAAFPALVLGTLALVLAIERFVPD